MQGGWTAGDDDAGERAFAEPDFGFRTGVRHEEGAEKDGEVGVVADYEKIFVVGILLKELLKVLEGGRRSERGGVLNLGFIAGFGADERRGLEAAFERARDDHVELDVESVQHLSELKALLFAFFIEGALDVE